MKLTSEELIVIIDPQKDFTDSNGAYAKRHPAIRNITEVKARINQLTKLIDKDRFVIIFSNYQKDQFGIGLSMCIEGTTGHEIDIDFDDSTKLIPKMQHSCFSSEEFENLLKINNIKKIILCGFLAEYCIKETAIDALHKGYKVALATEYIGTGDDVQHRKQETLLDLESKGAVIINSIFD
ncbi:cysteine hydrolase [Flavobacterium sp. F-65]|uniref:Cysteine hydrolase n=1 Tax=Flavobacterium pisciphilum TaxID=2893755 RepID=A0ABS8MTR0_9FLAO|nr:isochorismatase family cysteine hydrolase [Flavobacterium sp. F-65]MCC9072157.1 cysteine hydrolase [Flavobacterium sp. F-65]